MAFWETIQGATLDAIVGRAAYAGPAQLWAQIHRGNPGPTWTSNIATNLDGGARKQLIFGTPAANGEILNTNAPEWTAVGADTWSAMTIWDAVTGGNPISGRWPSAPISIPDGDVLSFPPGAIKPDWLATGAGLFLNPIKNKILDAVYRGVSYQSTGVWVMAHTGDPGVDGTSNIAADASRVQITPWGNPPTTAYPRTIDSTSTVIEWASRTATEVLTWVSFWSEASGGNAIAREDIGSKSVTIGDKLRVTPATSRFGTTAVVG